MAETKIQGETGRWTANQVGTQYLRQSGSGALRAALTEPESFEMGRAGRRFAIGQSAAITGIAPVQAMPTTAAQWVIWNPSLTKSLVFEQLGAYTVSGTAGVGSTVVAALITLPSTTSTKAGITIASMSGSTAQTSVALINSGVTVTSPAAPAWFIVARDDSPDTAVLNVMAIDRYVAGKIIVPPLRGLGLAVIAPTGTTPLYAPVAQWCELESDLE